MPNAVRAHNCANEIQSQRTSPRVVPARTITPSVFNHGWIRDKVCFHKFNQMSLSSASVCSSSAFASLYFLSASSKSSWRSSFWFSRSWILRFNASTSRSASLSCALYSCAGHADEVVFKKYTLVLYLSYHNTMCTLWNSRNSRGQASEIDSYTLNTTLLPTVIFLTQHCERCQIKLW